MHHHPHPHHHSRPDFFSRLLGGSLAAASFRDLAYYRAAFAQGLSATAAPLQKQITLESLRTGFLRSLASSNIPPVRSHAH